jgi:hypothetical protein
MKKNYSRKSKFLFSFITFSILFSTNFSCSESFFEEINSSNHLEKFKKTTKEGALKLRDYAEESNENKRIALDDPDMLLLIGEMDEYEAKEYMLPIVQSAVDLLRFYGLSDAEIISEFGSLESPEISRAALAITRFEDLVNDGYIIEGYDDTDFIIAGLFFQSAYAGGSQWYDCAIRAAGVEVLVQMGQGGISNIVKRLGKKGVIKLIDKIASRTLGYVGAAIAVYEFSDCMGWLDFPEPT